MANNITIGHRIKQVREEKKLSQEELANALGMHKSTIQRYETAQIEKIKLPVIEAISQTLDVNPEWLSDKTDVRTNYSTSDSPVERLRSQSVPYEPGKMIPIPVVGRVAAGYTCLAETDVECYELVDSESILDGYEYMWLQVKGDSMEPLILEGDLVLVRLQEMVNTGDYAVVIVDEEDGLVKQLEISKNSITLISVNRYYPPREFQSDDINRVRIVGKVTEIKRKL